MLYKFTYNVDGELKRKLCYTEREASIFFEILLACHYPFTIMTITRRRPSYGKISKR